ncbi:MAG: hypothetical protein Q3W96_02320 [Dysosmobacter sp.]|uniref:hypothetical protein n=1 Tax=Dysosmobacter sp. TaxID=2591382 RepID=UPI00283D57EC|nr:hypothetical protein [Dysosmobacter sp.]MDR3982255.1 hypothetical protein [Dysosmobacter sp.]
MKVLHRTASLLLLACLLLTLSACGSSDTPSDVESPDSAPEETQEETLETLCGEDYVTYIVDTITMQMENRMEKTPEVVFFPIEEDAPLTDYVTIDASTPFTLDEEDGSITLTFDAGMVTDAENGAQSFRIPLP